MLPVDEAGGQIGVDELFLQKELDDHPAKVFRHPFEVPERDMHEPAGLIEAAFHHDGVPVWIKPNKRTAGLIGQNHACVNRPIGRLGIEPFDHGENESVDIGEQAAVVPKVWA